MKKFLLALLLFVSITTVFFLSKKKDAVNDIPNSSEEFFPNQITSEPETDEPGQNLEDFSRPDQFQPPLASQKDRITKKPFGIFVSSQNSPVQPERFRGFHTGTDFEIFPGEENEEISVKAICTGSILQIRTAQGYGGVLIQRCELKNEPITVVYGHLNLTSISKNIGQNLNSGEIIGILGKGYSSETDGERKHLHLGIHKGTSINILGYVQNQPELSEWIDPCSLVCE